MTERPAKFIEDEAFGTMLKVDLGMFVRMVLELDWPMSVLFRIDGAEPDEVPPDVVARFGPRMKINFYAAGGDTVAGAYVSRYEVLHFEAPFYSTLGGTRVLAIPLDRILDLDVYPPATPVPPPERHGMRAV